MKGNNMVKRNVCLIKFRKYKEIIKCLRRNVILIITIHEKNTEFVSKNRVFIWYFMFHLKIHKCISKWWSSIFSWFIIVETVWVQSYCPKTLKIILMFWLSCLNSFVPILNFTSRYFTCYLKYDRVIMRLD